MSIILFMRNEKASRVLDAATSVFLRYGYRKTTMGDIASAAGLSRPALYLLYCNKERIFEGVVRRRLEEVQERLRASLAGPGSPMDRLRRAFELWIVEPFALVEGSPEAQDLLQAGGEKAREVLAEAQASFEAHLAAVLETLQAPRKALPLAQVARILAASSHGFKKTARNAQELREMIEGLLELTVQGLGCKS